MIRDLIGTPLKIYQTKKQPFNIDTILLANFANPTKDVKKIFDLGSGAGSLCLYMAYKTKANIVGVEIQEDIYQEALKNVEINQLQDRIKMIKEDINNLHNLYKDIDAIITNPPFFKISNKSKVNDIEYKTIARHEVFINLKQLIAISNKLLKTGGKIYMIHRPERVAEIIDECNQNRLKVKKVRFVHPTETSEANHVLIEISKDGSEGLKVLKPLILYTSEHKLTKEMQEIYHDIRHK
ncbi:methyltransferase [Acholeplasma sp. OttesenSCG-928-E16]|nr:methyltransferase [Acholeplasma sp. OttesenSCG-928-E16]